MMVYGLFQIKNPRQVYEECCKAKQARNAFKRDLPMKSKQKLDLVHYDVCGPFKVRSNGGNYYFLTRYMWMYVIEKMSDVFNMFKKFKLVVKNQSE